MLERVRSTSGGWWWMVQCGFVLALLSAAFHADAVSARRKSRPPLLEEAGRRKSSRQTHCQFGNHSFELEERWRPDLGPPFGVLYCVRCECVAVQRKKRIVARVKCQNIKNDCPKPTCETPVLLPERCCKTCPGEDYADLEEDLAMRKLEYEDDDKNTKEYSVMMTGRGVVPIAPTEGAARGYLVYLKKHLYYTIHYSRIDRPSLVRFTDEEGNILEEHEVDKASHHSNGSKICGVWTKLPKVYRRLLLKERLQIWLATDRQPDGILAGRVLRNSRIISSEIYSSLLTPEVQESRDTLGGGGIAIISPAVNSLHVTIDFNGVFSPKDARDVPVVVSVSRGESPMDRVTITETVVSIPKVHPDYNSISVKLGLDGEAQQLLATGKLLLKVSSRDGIRHLRGPILVKPTCNVFQAVLARDEQEAIHSTAPAAGMAILSISSDGLISYKATTEGLAGRPLRVALETEDPTTKQMRTLVEVTDPMFLDGWVNGTFSATTTREVEMLVSDDLHFALSTSRHTVELRGKIRQRLYSDAYANEMPVLLLPSSSGSAAAGQAWLAMDRDCHLHYHVFATGLERAEPVPADRDGTQPPPPRERHMVELLELLPTVGNAKGGRHQQRPLQKLDGDEAENSLDDLTASSLVRLSSGASQLLVTSRQPGRTKTVELRGRIQHLPMPGSCLPRPPDGVVQHRTGQTYMEDESNDIDDRETGHKCYYEGEVFEDGAQWKAQHDDCTMCSCQRGRVVCDPVVCPTPVCDHPVALSGECCPSCPGEGLLANASTEKTARSCYFEGDKKYHLAGTKWHPYIPPFGFSRCAVCTCEPETLTVECKRITCPLLTCPEKDAYREHALACCKKCPNYVPVKHHLSAVIPGHMGDQAEKKTTNDLLAAGGCQFRGQVFVNGAEWHPTVQPFGEMKCVNCHCKDGRARCRRQKCAKTACAVKVQREEECCPRCLDSTADARVSQRSTHRSRRKKSRDPEP